MEVIFGDNSASNTCFFVTGLRPKFATVAAATDSCLAVIPKETLTGIQIQRHIRIVINAIVIL